MDKSHHTYDALRDELLNPQLAQNAFLERFRRLAISNGIDHDEP